MSYKSDIEIAQQASLLPVEEMAKRLSIGAEYVENYGKYKAKIDYSLLKEKQENPNGKLILVTAISPTPAGEGKTTTTVGLGDALTRLGKKTIITLREPSLGPVFGVKGGAAGGGYAQVVPMEDINLHFTGDIHAIGMANNLLAALIDNHVFHGNELQLDVRKVTWKRCIDLNDRQLRNIVAGLNGRVNGMPREDGFDITAASEIMAILCLAKDIVHLKEMLAKIVVGFDHRDKPITAGDLKAEGALAALLREALKPNLVQTLENTPAFVHGGPFANIAHGCNSIMATNLALKLADYVVTEAGFGADLGMEKFLHIKCKYAGLTPSAVVLVASIRALKHHGGAAKEGLQQENMDALKKGLPNLLRHIDNITRKFGLPAVVAINRFPTDTTNELAVVDEACKNAGVSAVVSEVWEKGGAGGLALAEEVAKRTEESPRTFQRIYSQEDSIREKIEKIVKNLYGGGEVVYSNSAQKEMRKLEENGYGKYPICIAKTQYSFTDDPAKVGAPEGFTIHVKGLKVSAGAGFIVVSIGDIMTMPGLPKVPSAEKIDIDETGRISGLF